MFSKFFDGFLYSIGICIGIVLEALPTSIAFLLAYFFLKWTGDI